MWTKRTDGMKETIENVENQMLSIVNSDLSSLILGERESVNLYSRRFIKTKNNGLTRQDRSWNFMIYEHLFVQMSSLLSCFIKTIYLTDPPFTWNKEITIIIILVSFDAKKIWNDGFKYLIWIKAIFCLWYDMSVIDHFLSIYISFLGLDFFLLWHTIFDQQKIQIS